MKKGYLFFLLVIIIAVVIFAGEIIVQKYQNYHIEPHTNEKYHFTISYPKTYQDFQKKELELEDAVSQIQVSVSGESVNEYMKNINMSENIINLKSAKSGMRLLVDAIYTPKTQLDLEEICHRYAVMFKIYNEELTILSKQDEIVKIGDIDVGKVILTVRGKGENSVVIAYLFSLEDREFTVTFMTSESKLETVQKEIERIIQSVTF